MELRRDGNGQLQLTWSAEDVELNRRFLETMRGFLRSTMNVLREIPAAGAVHASLARAAGFLDRVIHLWHVLSSGLGGPSPDRAVDLGDSRGLMEVALRLIGEAIDALSGLLRGREREASPETYTLVDSRDTLRGVADGITWLVWHMPINGIQMGRV